MNTVPTVGFNCERVKGTVGKSRGLTFLIWDVGGQEKIRPLWRSYTRCTDGIIFVIDSSEEDNLDEAKLELWRTMKYQDNRDIPLLVLANKQDLQTALPAPDIEAALGNYIVMQSVTDVTTENQISICAIGKGPFNSHLLSNGMIWTPTTHSAFNIMD